MELLKRLWNDEEGQGLVEYALIIAIISLVIIVAGPTIATALRAVFKGVSDNLKVPTAS